jgi:hypothetical protein
MFWGLCKMLFQAAKILRWNALWATRNAVSKVNDMHRECRFVDFPSQEFLCKQRDDISRCGHIGCRFPPSFVPERFSVQEHSRGVTITSTMFDVGDQGKINVFACLYVGCPVRRFGYKVSVLKLVLYC